MPKAIAGAVLLAGGVGARLKAGTRKTNLKIGGKAIVEWPLLSLLASPLIGELALVVHARDYAARVAWARRQNFRKRVEVVVGGAERQDSVANGLSALDKGWEVLLVHDAARPFLNRSLIRDCVMLAKTRGAAIAAVPVKDSIKLIDGPHLKGLPRERLLAAQTPQACQAGVLRRAHAWAQQRKHLHTDEASLLEARGHMSLPVMAYYENFKVTTPEDFEAAKRVIKTFNFRG
jgi:2-C-methyl-D-erythritol 4-phosphate cytidylyltransferase